MAFGTDRASLNNGQLTITTRTWGGGEYQADLYLSAPGQMTESIVTLNHRDPAELRAFALALLAVADETEHQYDED